MLSDRFIKYFAILPLTFVLCNSVLSQRTDLESDELYKVHESNGLTVYVKFEIPNKPCSQNSKVKFLYTYKGRLEAVERYAKWELDYLDCSGVTYKMTAYAPLSAGCEHWQGYTAGEEFNLNERDEVITARKLLELRKNRGASSVYNSPEKNYKMMSESNKPDKLVSNKRTVKYKEEVELTVKGGSLGEGAVWKLYDMNCHTHLIGDSKERTFKLNPEKTMQYWVSAEGDNNITDCASITITVDTETKLPISIKGEKEVCLGGSVTLEQQGGELGPETNWYWYKDACGSGEPIGIGPSIEHTPEQTTVYFVRSESNDKTYITDYIQKEVKVAQRPVNPKNIINKTGSNNEICEGDEVILKVEGDLVSGAHWSWMKNGNEIARTKEIKKRPIQSTEYIVQMVSNVCGTSLHKSITISVYKKSIQPAQISRVFDPKKRKKSKLIFEGGSLAEKSNWYWYYMDEKGKQVPIGTGEEIEVKKGWDGKDIFLQAKGGYCDDKTTPIRHKVDYKKKDPNSTGRSFLTMRYAKAPGKWFHFGLQGGLDYLYFRDSITNIDQNFDSRPYNIESLAYYFGGELHPLFFEEFYFGINGGYGALFNNYLNYPALVESDNSKEVVGGGNYVYFGGEMGWTISSKNVTKMFLKYSRSDFKNNFTVNYLAIDTITGTQYTSNTYKNNNHMVIDRISLGFRFGAYDHSGETNNNGIPKLGSNFDLIVNLHNRSSVADFSLYSDFSSFSNLNDWKLGMELMYWKHNVLRIGFNTGFNSSFKEIFSGNQEFLPDYFIAKLAYSFDLFR